MQRRLTRRPAVAPTVGAGLRGVSADQDARFRNKEKKLLKSLKFPAEFSTKVDLRKVNWEVMKPWIARRVTELLGGLEDEVLIAYVYEQMEGKKVGWAPGVDRIAGRDETARECSGGWGGSGRRGAGAGPAGPAACPRTWDRHGWGCHHCHCPEPALPHF